MREDLRYNIYLLARSPDKNRDSGKFFVFFSVTDLLAAEAKRSENEATVHCRSA